MPSAAPPPGGRLVFALNREKFPLCVVGILFFGLVVFLKISHFHNTQKKVCGYLVCFKSLIKLALGRQVGEGTSLPAYTCTVV